MNSQKIVNLDTPVDDKDAVTKLYVDNKTGLHTTITDFDIGV